MSTEKEVVDKIAYITMQFPVPSETFASNDIDALSKCGFIVDIYDLKANHKSGVVNNVHSNQVGNSINISYVGIGF